MRRPSTLGEHEQHAAGDEQREQAGADQTAAARDWSAAAARRRTVRAAARRGPRHRLSPRSTLQRHGRGEHDLILRRRRMPCGRGDARQGLPDLRRRQARQGRGEILRTRHARRDQVAVDQILQRAPQRRGRSCAIRRARVERRCAEFARLGHHPAFALSRRTRMPSGANWARSSDSACERLSRGRNSAFSGAGAAASNALSARCSGICARGRRSSTR